MLQDEQLLCGEPNRKNQQIGLNFLKKALNSRTTTSIYEGVRLGCQEAEEQALFYRTMSRWPMERSQRTMKKLKPESYI